MSLRPTSLRRRITLTGVSVVTVLVLAFDVFVYLALRDRLNSELDRVLTAREQLVRGLSQELGPIQLRDRLDELGVRAVIRDPQGEEHRTGGAPAFEALPPSTDARSRELMARLLPHPDGGEIAVLASRAGIDDTLERLLLLEAVGTVALVALAYALLSRSSSRVLRPVSDVARTAREIASGRLHERLDDRPQDDELAEMVSAFNEMVDALEESVERTRRSDASSRQFLADAAHQLRNPVAGVRATVATMLRTEASAERERMMDNVASELARMSRLVSALLRVARLDAREPPTFRRVDVGELITDVVEKQAVLAPRKTIDVALEGDLVAEVSPDGLAEALENLFDNAIRYADEQVWVEVRPLEDQVEVIVADDGPGVPAAASERIFERFVSLDGGDGSGLGLPIARGIARSHGGTLVYEDARFVLRVPRKQDAAS